MKTKEIKKGMVRAMVEVEVMMTGGMIKIMRVLKIMPRIINIPNMLVSRVAVVTLVIAVILVVTHPLMKMMMETEGDGGVGMDNTDVDMDVNVKGVLLHENFARLLLPDVRSHQ